jgi:acyl carrier protein
MTATVTPTEIDAKLLETIAELSDCGSEVTREATLEDLDMDSLDLVELGQIVAEEWGVQLQPDDFKEVKNVGDAIDVVIAKAS